MSQEGIFISSLVLLIMPNTTAGEFMGKTEKQKIIF